MPDKLPDEFEKIVYEHATLGRKAVESGNIELAEQEFLKAWLAMPEPRTQWDMAQSITRGFIDFYLSNNNPLKAEKWLDNLSKAYGSPDDGSVAILTGIVHYELGQFDLAYERFNFLFKQWKARPFQGEDKKYLEFYLKESASRKKHTG